jgi:hypothetical protein
MFLVSATSTSKQNHEAGYRNLSSGAAAEIQQMPWKFRDT